MTTQHTHESWTLISNDETGFFEVHASCPNNQTCFICKLESESDARLIAAAPELLAVLQTVLEHCEGKGWRSDHVTTLVKNTISKATQP